MKQAYWDFDLIRLSAESAAVHLNNEFILIDNFNETSEQSDTDFEFVNHPVKLSFTVALLCLAGQMRAQVNLQDFELRTNDVLVVQNGTIGEYRGMSDDARIAVIAFTPEYFQTALQIEATMSLQRRLYASPLWHLPFEAMEELMVIYRLMKAKIAETDNPFRKGALLGYTQVLIYNCYKYLLAADSGNEKTEVKSGRQQELYTQFMDEVRKSYIKERSISYYADVLCVTPKYLSQVVRRVSGRFAGDWITDFVILEAKALLKSRKYTVQQIADMLNFANQSFFGKYFREKVGCSPKAYQENG
ncbi:MAG: AraC family transcriptional regulator [Alistipes sp.]|jgi:AraC-like DNA-binding protein|uniref:helix-turn-helix domain-containing protein n=1 Tax=Alistipes sp. TaxID=1872444 RepID=UPI001D3C5847|nr:helix-turn-helix domain-containing protein [Alistipes sp.]MBS5021403.1 AraC family transcriptional regulator [Alistipes sp.]